MKGQRRRLVGGCLLLTTLASIYILTMATSTATNDANSATLTGWRIASTGQPWLEGLDHAALTGRDNLWLTEASNGHVVATRSPGPISAAVPGYLAARLVGVTDYSMVPGSVMAALLTTGALGLFYLSIRPRTGPVPAAIAVGAFGLTTPVWSVSADSLWTHPITVLGIAGMALGCARERWWLVGMFGGVALWGRLHTAVIVAVLGLALAWTYRQPRIAAVVGSVSACWLGLTFVWSRWVYGEWRFAGGYSVGPYAENAADVSDFTQVITNQAGHWIAPDRGLLVWTPVLLLLVPALVRSWRDLPAWTRWLAGGGLLYIVIQGQLNGFTGGYGFYGYRLSLELLACLLPAYAMSAGRVGRIGRALLGPVLGLQFAVIAFGAGGDGGLLSEDEVWTNNSFVHAATEAPILWAWAGILTVLGHLIARVMRRRGAVAAAHSRFAGAGDHLDRV